MKGSPLIGPSATLSLVAHVALIGAAIRGTAINAHELQEAVSQRIAYLPPPDRHGGRNVAVEHLEYIDIGGGAPVAPKGTQGTPAPGGPNRTPRPGGDERPDTPSEEHASADPAPDSVYSVLEVEERAVRTSSSAAPAYPAALMKDGTEGRVLLRFVVDTTGRADSTSIEVLSSTHPAFTASVRAAVPHMSFTPASVGTRHVRQSVEQNFEFRIATLTAAPAEQTRTKPVP